MYWVYSGRGFDGVSNSQNCARSLTTEYNKRVVSLIFILISIRSLIMRTIEIKDSVELSFNYRNDASVLKENAVEVKVVADLSKLSAEDLLEWAYSAMVVSYQSKLRSKTPPTKNAEGKYEWSVPSRGTRSTADPKKVEEQAEKLIGKMSQEQKQHQMYNILISMGKSEAEAVAISGYTKPTAAVAPTTP